MVGNIEVFGRMESNMEKENSLQQIKKHGKKEYGKMEKELDGLMQPLEMTNKHPLKDFISKYFL
jgi:hypothetical protein